MAPQITIVPNVLQTNTLSEERGRADVLEHDVAVDAAGGLADRLAEALDLVEVALARVGVVQRELAPVEHRLGPQLAHQPALVVR